MRTLDQKLNCIKNVIINAQKHVKAGDPPRIYSQYVRYALNEFTDINFYISDNAKGMKRKDVIHEHVIPDSPVMSKLLALDPLSKESILDIIKRYYVICVITKEEDRLLNAAGLRSKMPEGWSDISDSVFARYQKVGLSISRLS
ncbi:hypothetical protein CWE08_05375 [Aliidiomarina iranensis]|uniref:Uncharacterized protein n=1 Tax=Aliidiomarina iranensis TaxID=1434071 RepID=A0A432W0R3_9GAMM|nr:hypothetical protein [Aliidiomarina iranensis]RUO22605.1 hypothetical protein CWE08_05375 [Aliidiomarina iranensis]